MGVGRGEEESREYLDLATFCVRQGLPDYFITIMAGWS